MDRGKSRGRIRFRAFLALAFLFFVLTCAAEARVVALGEAWSAAARLLAMENSRPDQRLSPGFFELSGVELLYNQGRPVAYLVNLKPQGFMILSDITEVTPQVFVSYSGDFAEMRTLPFLLVLLDRLDYNKVHLGYMAGGASRNLDPDPEEVPDRVQMERNERAWAGLLGEAVPEAEFAALAASAPSVAPLMTTTWNQNAPYWNYTPRVGGTATYTGCAATAMAQVLYFWKCPQRGQGSHSYWWNGETLSANYDHVFAYDKMKASYSSGYSAEEADAVARLMSDVGIALDMNYGTGGSSAHLYVNNALSTFFKYSGIHRTTFRREYGGWDGYFNAIRQQIEMFQPVLLAIYTADAGHAVVADGFRTSPSNQAHVNMGWGGSQDNYYAMDNIYGYGYANWDYAIVDIHPQQVGLTLQASASGTTDPGPGSYNYDYATGKTVRVTAKPDAHYEFLNWSGDASGKQNPVDVAVNKGMLNIKANFGRIIEAPTNASGQKVLNRALAKGQYINIITWAPNPNNVDIQAYKIYQVEGGQKEEIASLDSTGTFFWHRDVLKSKEYTYHIVAVNKEPREGAAAVVIVR